MKYGTPLLIFVLVLAAYILTAGGHLYSPDEEVYFRTTQALATSHTLAILPIDPSGFLTRQAAPTPLPGGLVYGQYAPGQPLLAIPLYHLGNWLATKAPESFWAAFRQPLWKSFPQPATPPPTRESAQRFACSWFNILLGPLLALLLYFVCLELTGHRKASAWAALLYALGSMAWPHSRPFFSESCATFFILLAWYGLLRAGRGRLIPWCLLAGAAAGYAFLVREDAVLAYPALAILLAGPIVAAARRQERGIAGPWVAFCIPALACGAVLLGLNWAHFGHPFATGHAGQSEGVTFSTPLAAGLYGFLFSAGKGLFFFSPALALGLVGWAPLARLARERHRALIWAIAAAIAVPLLVLSKWINWPGGWCWGPRHIFIIHVFLALPIAAWLAAAWGPRARVAAVVFLFLGAAVQLLGSSQDFITYYFRFFRSPGDRATFFVLYDQRDLEYWSQYYKITYFPPYVPGQPVAPPLETNYPPRPIQDSLYIPQASVWNGYPQMLSEGHFDNFWLHWYQMKHPAAVGAPSAPGAPGAATGGVK